MRPANSSSVQYSPGPIPTENGQFNRFLEEELRKIAAAIQLLADGHLDEQFAIPLKPRNGDIRYADGTMWNPGSGRGIYGYNGETWNLIASMA